LIRREWEDLSAEIRKAIEVRTGPVVKAESPNVGRHSELSATLYTDSGAVFCKGITIAQQHAYMHDNEARINPFLPHFVAPRLLWQIETDGWRLLGFERVVGQHANLSPGSPDLPLVAEAITEIGRTPAPPPELARRSFAAYWSRLQAWHRLGENPPEDLDPWLRANLDRLAEWAPSAATLLDGDRLLHTDLHSLNILVDDTARIIDWAWWRTGAPLVDVGFMVARLVAAGHTPDSAEAWADTIPAWAQATIDAQTTFAVTLLGAWEWLQRNDPRPLWPALTAAVRSWVRHRLAVHT
jgi:hypothetical protein